MLASKRPFLISLFNAIGFKIKLNADDLLHKAKQKTSLNDFGKGNIHETLTRLIDAINNEAQMHPFGRFITKERILGILQNRLRLEDFIKRHPAIENIEIKNPLIITGLQRTGTTRLHRLLAAHPQLRSLSSWEALSPVPFPNDEKNKKRIHFAKTAEKALRFMSPDFFAIHPVEFEAPEEDVLLNEMTFLSAVSEATMYVPSFVKWVSKQDPVIPYQYMKRVLKVLQWQNPKEHWVLKTPEHLGQMHTIQKVFPDAKVIHTYRDPLKVIPSFSSMLYHSNRIFSDEVNAVRLARHWMNKDVKMLKDAMKFWQANPSFPVLHISYTDMVKDYQKELKKIADFAQINWTNAEQEAVTQIDNLNKQHKYGIHKYSLDQFNLTKQEVQNNFDFYYKEFIIK